MRHCIAALLLGTTVAAQAQESPLAFSVGVKAWNTQWTTFGYDTNGAGDQVITQVPAEDKTVFVPLLSLRWRDVVASISGYPSTRYDFVGGGSNQRKELDLNVGYLALPNLALTLGYKKVGQKADTDNYELGGFVFGISATAPLANAWALYGSLGLGRLKDTAASTVKFDADYRLTEAGIAYTLALDRWLRTLSFTAGYRMQVLSSKDALAGQDGRDLTQGLTFGVVATF